MFCHSERSEESYCFIAERTFVVALDERTTDVYNHKR